VDEFIKVYIIDAWLEKFQKDLKVHVQK